MVDPRPFEAALDQAEAILEKDLSRVREAQANRVSNESHLKHAEAILKKDQMTLYLTPVVYIYLDRFQKKISRKGSIFRVKSAERVEEQAGAREAGYH